MIELLTWATPNGTKPSIMLEEVSQPYSLRLVDIAAGEQFSPAFLTVSPNNKIPALIDRDDAGGRRVVFESGAILVYLAEKTGAFLASSGTRRDQALSWLFWGMSGVGPTLGRFLHSASLRDDSAAATTVASEAVRLLHVLDRRLAEARYLAEDYSIADIGAFTWIRSALPTIRTSVGDQLGATPGVDRWLDEIGSRPAVQRGLRAPKVVVRKGGS